MSGGNINFSHAPDHPISNYSNILRKGYMLNGFSILFSQPNPSCFQLRIGNQDVRNGTIYLDGYFGACNATIELARLSVVVINLISYGGEQNAITRNSQISAFSVSYYSPPFLESAYMHSFNTFIGVKSINSSEDYFDFQSSPTFSSLFRTSSSTSCEIFVILFLANYCEYRNPYYHQADDRCYDVCPIGYTANKAELECEIFVEAINRTESTNISLILIICGSVIAVIILSVGAYVIYQKCKSLKGKHEK